MPLTPLAPLTAPEATRRADGRQRDRAWIAAHVPHHGAMCLIDRIEDWSADGLSCVATSHADAANPLRAGGRLGSANAIEYAAQAMALHGALLAPDGGAGRPRAGFLASVRGVNLHVGRLDDLGAPLAIVVTRFSGDANNILYDFSIAAAGRPVADGRAAVILDAGDGLFGAATTPKATS